MKKMNDKNDEEEAKSRRCCFSLQMCAHPGHYARLHSSAVFDSLEFFVLIHCVCEHFAVYIYNEILVQPSLRYGFG